MRKILLCILLLAFTAQTKSDQKISEVWGQIIKVEENQAFHGHRYFVFYVKDKKEHAYPIEIKNPKQEKLIMAHVNKMAKISGTIHSLKIVNDGSTMTIVYFSPEKVTPLALSQLGVTSTSKKLESAPDGRVVKNYTEGGIRIPDQAANIAIFTAGSLLVGSILKDYLQKK